jgi:dienelactone hydrolase
MLSFDWQDADRKRTIPVRLYVPKQADARFPVVVFSSGVGAGRESLEFLGRHLASRGFISVHIQHPGSDEQIFAVGAPGATGATGASRRETVLKVVHDRLTGITRLLDLVFVLDKLTGLAATSPELRGRIDLDAIAVGGINLGAATALGAAGLATEGRHGEESSLPDPRVKAIVLFQPPALMAPRQRQRLHFEHVTVPCLHVIGLEEEGAMVTPAERRYDFDHIAYADQVLVTLQGNLGRAAGARLHLGRTPARGADAADSAGDAADTVAVQDRLKIVVTAFLDGYLRHIATARQWVAGGGLGAVLGAAGQVETKSRP